MARAVLPQSSAMEEWLLRGRTEGPPRTDERQPQLSREEWELADAAEWVEDEGRVVGRTVAAGEGMVAEDGEVAGDGMSG